MLSQAQTRTESRPETEVQAAQTVAAAPLSGLVRGAEWIAQRLALVAVLAVLLIAFANVSNVILRSLFATSLYGLNEINTLLVAIAVSSCLPYGMVRDAPLKITGLRDMMPPRVAVWFNFFGALFMMAFLAVVAWRIGAYAMRIGAANQTTVMTDIPKAPFFWGVAISVGLATLVQMAMAARAAANAVLATPRWGYPILVAIVLGIGWTSAVMAGLTTGTVLFGTYRPAPLTLSLIAVVLMWVITLLTVPLGAAMGITGILGAAAVLNSRISLEVLGAETISYITRDALSVLPLFLLMGAFAGVAGIGTDLYRLANVLIGHIRGGLAHASILACAGFGTLTGSSVATQMSIGKIALKEMQDRGYSNALCAGSIAAGGTLGQLIPPSGALIVYAVMTEQSVGRLFMGALIPGILAAILYMFVILIWVLLFPQHATRREGRTSMAELLSVSLATWSVLLLLGIVLGGIYFGVFTELEAGSVGAAGAFLIALARGRLNFSTFWKTMGDTTITLSMMYSLIFGVVMLSFFFGVAYLPQTFVAWVNSFGMTPIMVVVTLVACYLLLGTIMDEFAMMVITIPIFVPLVVNLGFDPIWWGVLTMLCMSAGAISPPAGLNIFVISSLDPRIPLSQVYLGCTMFFISAVIKIGLLIAFPALVTWLPNTM